MLNGIPADKLMTTTTNQTFDDFYIPVLKIDNLFAEKVNGIPIEEAARKSRKNVIKGNLREMVWPINYDNLHDYFNNW